MKHRLVLCCLVLCGLLAGVWFNPAAHANPLRQRKPGGALPQAPVHRAHTGEPASPRAGDSLASAWSTVVSPNPLPLKSVDMASAEDGWAVGYHHRATNGVLEGQSIVRWDGYVWSERYSNDTGSPLLAVDMVSSDDGWIVGGNYDWVHRWDGQYWNPVESPSYHSLNAVNLLSESDGWAVGGDGLCQSGGISGTILRWDGASWNLWFQSIANRVLYGVDMLSASDGWAVGYYCYFSGTPPASYDSVIMRWNGSNWSYVDSPTYQTLYAVEMISATDGWIVGDRGVTLRWNGSAWNEVSSPTECALRSVSAVAWNDVWAVGGAGYFCASQSTPVILHWNGSAWSEVASPAAEVLNSVAMLSAEDGWIVGDGGTILRYMPPEKQVRVVGAGAADYDWNWKNEFNPGDPIRWFIQIENDSGQDAQVELTYDVRGPGGQTVFYDQYVDTIPAGMWYWGDDGTVPEGMGGVHTLTGSGLYQGTASQFVFTYTVSGPASYAVYLPAVVK